MTCWMHWEHMPMRVSPHHHPCWRCGKKTECCGDVEQNYDGWPTWVCREYHTVCGTIDFRCEACHELDEAEAKAALEAAS